MTFLGNFKVSYESYYKKKENSICFRASEYYIQALRVEMQLDSKRRVTVFSMSLNSYHLPLASVCCSQHETMSGNVKLSS